MKRRLKLVDVFGARPFTGNPVAVVLDAEGLELEQMGEIARWTNLSETTFVLPAEQGGDYRLRIFTAAGGELPFAGHPTLGSAHAFIEAGGRRQGEGLLQECAAGLVKVGLEVGPGGDGRASFEAPAAQTSVLAAPAVVEILAALGTDARTSAAPLIVNVGPRWVVIDLGDAGAVARAAPDFARLERQSRALGITGVTVFGRTGSAGQLQVRSFAPAEGVPEDPVCGSGNASVAAYLVASAGLDAVGPRYTALQGQQIGRDGRIEVAVLPDRTSGATRIVVTGATRTLVDGTLDA
jgi:PhzF family phenazine biosynthesis protein